jgi:two-component system phosphate regulon response regulator PhoB
VEFRLLAYFMENPGRVLPRRHLLDQVWHRRNGIGERTVDVHIRRLRAALEPHACDNLLQTVRGFGYRFG